MLKASGQEDPKFPHPFELTITVALEGNTLTQELRATNTGAGGRQRGAGGE